MLKTHFRLVSEMVDDGVFFLADDMDLPEPDYKVSKDHWSVSFKHCEVRAENKLKTKTQLELC